MFIAYMKAVEVNEIYDQYLTTKVLNLITIKQLI